MKTVEVVNRHDQLLALQAQRNVTYTDRDVILYALSVGMGQYPNNVVDAPFVNEFAGLQVIPTMVTVLAPSGLLNQSVVDFGRVVHAEQSVKIHSPLPPGGQISYVVRVAKVIDKGTGKGAVISMETEVVEEPSKRPLATMMTTVMARGDGGLGGPQGLPSPRPHPMPGRRADLEIVVPTRKDQAALYRLNGDRNPLHIDVPSAAKVGFSGPILHGLCTYGIACRTIIEHCCDGDPQRISEFDARFTAAVYPGETLVMELWRDARTVSFRCVVPQRGVVVLDHGRCLLSA